MDLAILHDLIVKHFNEDELKMLCFTLSPSVDYESLPAIGKSGKVRELLAYCNRHGRMNELINDCKKLRPKVNWLEFIPTSQTHENLQVERRSPTDSVSKSHSIPKLKVFLCHASGDKNIIRELYHNLQSDGFEPWLDEEDLLAGQEWRTEIPKAVRSSDVVIVCLSQNSVTKRGYVQKEIKIALDVADEQPEGAIFLIPARLEECDVPDRLNHLQWVDLYAERGYERLIDVLTISSKSLYGNVVTPIFDASEIGFLIEKIGWRQSREGYSSTAPISKLKDKLFQMGKDLRTTGHTGNNLSMIELSLLLETVRENVSYISQYKYEGMSDTEANRQRAETLAPLLMLQDKLKSLTIKIDS